MPPFLLPRMSAHGARHLDAAAASRFAAPGPVGHAQRLQLVLVACGMNPLPLAGYCQRECVGSAAVWSQVCLIARWVCSLCAVRQTNSSIFVAGAVVPGARIFWPVKHEGWDCLLHSEGASRAFVCEVAGTALDWISLWIVRAADKKLWTLPR